MNLKDVKFPMGFEYKKVDRNLHITSNSGRTYFETPIMCFIGYISLSMIVLGALIGIISTAYLKAHHYNVNIDTPILFASIIAGIGIILLIINISNSSIKTDFFVSSDGIKIKSKKGTLFIEKDNIEKIYSSEYTSRNWTYYKVFLICKKNIYLDVAKKYEKEFSLFCDIDFNNLTTAEFIINQFTKTLKLDKKEYGTNKSNKTAKKIDSKNKISLEKNIFSEEQNKEQNFLEKYDSEQQKIHTNFTNINILKDEEDYFSFLIKPQFELFWFFHNSLTLLILGFMLYFSSEFNNTLKYYSFLLLFGSFISSVIILYHSKGANIVIEKSKININYKWIFNISMKNSVTIDINNSRKSKRNLQIEINEMNPFFRREARNKNIFRVKLSSYENISLSYFSEVVKYLTKEEAEYIVNKIEEIIKM